MAHKKNMTTSTVPPH